MPTADELRGIAYVIGAAAMLVLAVALFFTVKKVALKMGKVEATVETVHDSVNGVDKAIGESKLIDKVRSLETGMALTNEKLDDHIHATAEWQEFVKGQLAVLVAVAGQTGLTASAAPEAPEQSEGL